MLRLSQLLCFEQYSLKFLAVCVKRRCQPSRGSKTLSRVHAIRTIPYSCLLSMVLQTISQTNWIIQDVRNDVLLKWDSNVEIHEEQYQSLQSAGGLVLSCFTWLPSLALKMLWSDLVSIGCELFIITAAFNEQESDTSQTKQRFRRWSNVRQHM